MDLISLIILIIIGKKFLIKRLELKYLLEIIFPLGKGESTHSLVFFRNVVVPASTGRFLIRMSQGFREMEGTRWGKETRVWKMMDGRGKGGVCLSIKQSVI